MDEQRTHSGDGPLRGRGGPAPWRHGPAALRRWEEWVERRGLPWASTLAVTVFVQVGSGFAEHAQLEYRAKLDVFARLLLLVASLLLLLRHRHPVPVVYGVAAATMVYLGAGYPYGPVFFCVALGVFAAIVAGRRWAAWGAIGMLWLGHLLIAHWLYRWLPPGTDHGASWGGELVVAAWVVAIAAVAELARNRREQWAKERVEREQAAKRRADEERLRIARELHDVLAHSISVINVQAGVGLALLDSDPEQTAPRSPPSSRRARRPSARSARSSTPCAPRARPRAPRPRALTGCRNSSSRPRAPDSPWISRRKGSGSSFRRARIWPRSGSCRRH